MNENPEKRSRNATGNRRDERCGFLAGRMRTAERLRAPLVFYTTGFSPLLSVDIIEKAAPSANANVSKRRRAPRNYTGLMRAVFRGGAATR
jgi:hypothetical protein